jgi:hypothetical protein
MNGKYYTPSGTEFHVGFEYEIFEDFDFYEEESWHEQIYGRNGYDQESLGHVQILLDPIPTLVRVKFLDREDIESLGWTFNNENLEFLTFDRLVGGNTRDHLWVLRLEKDSRLYIRQDKHCRFLGTIKNKSELRRLMKQLGI